jgi:SGNH domain-containing protein
VSRQDFLARNDAVIRALKDAAEGNTDVRAIDATNLMCGSSLCLPFDGGTQLYSDNFHLTIAGADRFSQGFAGDLAWAFDEATSAIAEKPSTK